MDEKHTGGFVTVNKDKRLLLETLPGGESCWPLARFIAERLYKYTSDSGNEQETSTESEPQHSVLTTNSQLDT